MDFQKEMREQLGNMTKEMQHLSQSVTTIFTHFMTMGASSRVPAVTPWPQPGSAPHEQQRLHEGGGGLVPFADLGGWDRGDQPSSSQAPATSLDLGLSIGAGQLGELHRGGGGQLQVHTSEGAGLLDLSSSGGLSRHFTCVAEQLRIPAFQSSTRQFLGPRTPQLEHLSFVAS